MKKYILYTYMFYLTRLRFTRFALAAITSAAVFLSNGALYAACPTGYTEVDVGDLYRVVIDDGACPSGFTEISPMSLLLPAPAGGTDEHGTYSAPICSYNS